MLRSLWYFCGSMCHPCKTVEDENQTDADAVFSGSSRLREKKGHSWVCVVLTFKSNLSRFGRHQLFLKKKKPFIFNLNAANI